ncbi:hypothetical protein V6Z11_A08G100500 [Gossypium hirsutum]
MLTPSFEEDEEFPSTPGKFKIDRSHNINRHFRRCFASTSTIFQSFVESRSRYFTSSCGAIQWENQVRNSGHIHRSSGMSVLVTGAAGFVGSHVFLALKKRGDGVVGLDNFNNYYDPSLKKARNLLLNSHRIFVVEGNLNDAKLLAKLFDAVAFTHVMHLAAQAGVRYAMENPNSYVQSNIAGLVTLLEACKSANPQPAVVWASSSSVYGLNEKIPFSEADRTDQPAILYAATKKAGRPDMAYFSFTRNILQGKPITIFRGKNRGDLARDFTYIDDIVKGCLGSIDTSGTSTGSGGKKRGPAPYRIFNLGNTSPVRVPELVTILERHLKLKAERNIVDMPGNGDVPFTHASICLAEKELGFEPITDLQTGLNKFVKMNKRKFVE